MVKVKSIWVCSSCGHQESKWVGQCRACGSWNTFLEEAEPQSSAPRFFTSATPSKAVLLSDVPEDNACRIQTHLEEFDRLLGGGIVKGGLTLVGGEPGIGKSTLMLQVSEALSKQGLVVLYLSGEESLAQTALRAKRLKTESDNLYLLSETHLEKIISEVERIKPDLLVIDSIQIIYKSEITSAPGSVSQVRECATELMHLAKHEGIATFIIGHVTKSGEIAGPKVLEHIVDTVLYFEGDKEHNFRLMRGVKNRFGPTDEIALFQMQERGLVQVANPSQIFLQERQRGKTGSAIIPLIEGSRPLLVEVQALVAESSFPSPTRRSSGIDPNRLALLLAVLEKRVGYPLHKCDVFVSLAGGLKVAEPALDLGILMAVASSLTNRSLDSDTVVMGEVGLGGEVRSVVRAEHRLKEAVAMGFLKGVIPERLLKGISPEISQKIALTGVNTVEEAIATLL